MGLLSTLLFLPLKGPVDGSLWVARKITEAAEAQMNDPSALRQALADAERQLEAGDISEEEYEELEEVILQRLQVIPR